MNRGFAIALSIILVVAIGCVGLFLYWQTQQDESNYNLISRWWTGSGKFIDYSNDTGVKDAKDIVYYVDQDDKYVEILYGYITLKYTFKQLQEQDWIDKLAYIGLTYEIKPTTKDDFRFYWCGTELERCADKPSVG